MSVSGRQAVAGLVIATVLFTTVAAAVGVPSGGLDGNDGTYAAQSGGTTEVNNCGTITEPGHYVLTKDIRNGGSGDQFTFISESCIQISASDVTFDAKGHTIDGMGVSDTTAIQVGDEKPVSNVTVTNARIKEWNRAVYFSNVEGGTVTDVDATGNSFGVFADGSSDLTIENVESSQSFVGVYLNQSQATLTDNSFTGNVTTPVLREQSSSEA